MKITNTKAPIIFLMGPTASGKTGLAIDLHQNALDQKSQVGFERSRFEIISVDSAMVYTQMNIGSAKPSDKELAIAPHFLIDFIDPKESYSVSQFCDDAKLLINNIHQRGNVPLLVGGSMLYFKALKNGLANMPQTEEKIRQQVKIELDEKGLAFLHQELEKIDPESAARLHINDSQRITRAIEVFRMTGKSLSNWHKEQNQQILTNPLLSIALAPQDRKILHSRIEQRFEQMIEAGFLDEVASLYYRGDLNLDCPSMRCVGYRQIWQYMDGELSLSEAKERAIIATRQLAKRQYTWLRSWVDIQWFDPSNRPDLNAVKQTIKAFIGKYC